MALPNYTTTDGIKAGSSLYVKDFYYYSVCNRTNTTTYLLCHKNTCHGRAKIRGATLTHSAQDGRPVHNHPPEIYYEEVRALILRIKERVQTENGSLRAIFDEECARVPGRVRSEVIFSRVEKTLGNIRRAHLGNVPQNLEELDELLRLDDHVHGRYAMIDGGPWYRGMCGPPEHRSLIFITNDGLQILRGSTEIAVDGTFRSRPHTPESRQILIIVAYRFEHAFPVGFVLMQSKSREAYEEVFRRFRAMVPAWNPETIHCDFEISLMQALAAVFVLALILGCWFHFKQRIHRKKRRLGLYYFFRDNDYAKRLYRLTGCLPLAPSHEISNLVDNLCWYAEQTGIALPRVRAFLTYVHNTWVRVFGPEVLSVFMQPVRSNNAMENTNRQYNKAIGVMRPNVYIWFDRTAKFVQAMGSDFERARRNKRLSRSVNQRILNVNEVITEAQERLLRGEYSVWQFLNTVTDSYHEVFEDFEGGEEDDADDDDMADVPPGIVQHFPRQPQAGPRQQAHRPHAQQFQMPQPFVQPPLGNRIVQPQPRAPLVPAVPPRRLQAPVQPAPILLGNVHPVQRLMDPRPIAHPHQAHRVLAPQLVAHAPLAYRPHGLGLQAPQPVGHGPLLPRHGVPVREVVHHVAPAPHRPPVAPAPIPHPRLANAPRAPLPVDDAPLARLPGGPAPMEPRPVIPAPFARHHVARPPLARRPVAPAPRAVPPAPLAPRRVAPALVAPRQGEPAPQERPRDARPVPPAPLAPRRVAPALVALHQGEPAPQERPRDARPVAPAPLAPRPLALLVQHGGPRAPHVMAGMQVFHRP